MFLMIKILLMLSLIAGKKKCTLRTNTEGAAGVTSDFREQLEQKQEEEEEEA